VVDDIPDDSGALVGIIFVEDDATADLCRSIATTGDVTVRLCEARADLNHVEWLETQSQSEAPCLAVIDISSLDPISTLDAVRAWAEAAAVAIVIPHSRSDRRRQLNPLRENERAVARSQLKRLLATLSATGTSTLLRSVQVGTQDANDDAGDGQPLLGELVHQVKRTARRACRRLPDGMRQDAEGAAMVGLMEALRRFDDADSTHFGNYLRVRVRGAIQDEARRFDPLSRNARELVNNVEKVAEEHRRAHGGAPEIDEIARQLGIDEDTCWEALELSEYSTLPIEDDAVSSSVLTAEDLFVETYAATALRWALAQLDKRTRLVLRLWYKRGLPVAAIARRIGVSTARAHQIRVEGERELERLLQESPPLNSMTHANAPFDWDEETEEDRTRTRFSS